MLANAETNNKKGVEKLRYDRETDADRRAKEMAQRQGKRLARKAVNKAFQKKAAGKAGTTAAGKAGAAAGKAGATAGKAGAAAIQKVVAAVVAAIGWPVLLIILVVILLLLFLPSLVTSSMYAIDNKYSPDELGATAIGPSWEDDAENAINTRYQDLKTETFWADLGTFFTTGKWGESGERFETEFANAKDSDMDGTDGYFSSSNRLVAIINEAFRQSLKRSRIKSEAEDMAQQAIPEIENELRASAEHGRPADVAEEDYHIVVTVAQDPDYSEDQNFIFQSCYMIAAASGELNNNDEHDVGVRKTLDVAFEITGLDGNTDKEICWDAETRAEYDHTDETTTALWYETVDREGNTHTYANIGDIPTGETVTHVETKKEVTVYAYSYWSVKLAPDYQDIINRRCGIETTLPDDAASYEYPQVSFIQTSALELAKFYSLASGDWGSVGEAGLPLPSGSYIITSPFGWRVLNGRREKHKGLDMAAAEGTPIYAVKDGICTVSGHDPSYGNCVSIDHGDGLMTRYAHMSLVVVTDGQSVTAGEVIGFVGATGNATGNHLHFEVRINNNPVDPLSTELGPAIQSGQR